MEPEIEGKTPDLLARNDEPLVVEVVHVNPSAATRAEERWIAGLAERLREVITLTEGSFLSLGLHGPARGAIPGPVFDRLAASLQEWFDAGHQGVFDFHEGSLGISGTWMPHHGQDIAIGQARALSDAKRFQDRVGTKIGTYRGLAKLNLPIVVLVGTSHWTLTRHGLIDGLFGGEQVRVTLDQQGIPAGEATSLFSGEGVLVRGGPSGHSAAGAIAGVLWGEFGGFDMGRRTFGLDVMYIHNPYTERTLKHDAFAPLAEYQPSGGTMAWVRGEVPGRLWLDCPEP